MADYSDDMDAAQAQTELIRSREVNGTVAAIRAAEAIGGTDDCTDCGRDIDVARRRAHPAARRCLSCQQAAERRGHLGRGA
jgi:phage/conjugal plasmid C-4 type zinc finger TraR family protein